MRFGAHIRAVPTRGSDKRNKERHEGHMTKKDLDNKAIMMRERNREMEEVWWRVEDLRKKGMWE